MDDTIRVASAQLDLTVGDLDGNSAAIEKAISKARGLGADIVTFPELALTGYPPEDLLLKPKFIDDNFRALERVAKAVSDIVAVVGFVDRTPGGLFNSAAVICGGAVRGIYHKMMLPNYGVFDEKRYFMPGTSPAVFTYGDLVFAVNICEDIWHDNGPLQSQASAGARLILNINASPYYMGKTREREALISGAAARNRVFICYTNLVGGQDELVFDGQSMAFDPRGRITARSPAFDEDLLVCDLKIDSGAPAPIKAVPVAPARPSRPRPAVNRPEFREPAEMAEVFGALTLGLKDYVRKNGFSKTVVGLSGGIDSALVAAIASDALGRENVTGVFMPSRYSSKESEDDAREVASNLGIKYTTIPIDHIFKIYLMALEQQFAGTARGLAEENLQARIRGNILMALSNKFGWLVLTTGNKSEMSAGYATLYGDMAGGLAVIKDVPKTLVYRLARHRNTIGRVIPERVLSKEPTAELRPDQKDSDSLPPYETLDPIIKSYVEEDSSADEIASKGFDPDTVSKVISLVDKSEYKRRQSPPGIKITPKAFGKDRRMPITNRYRG
jgi:NAD+ synthase (glutamine-hydrolysing)